VKASRKKSGQSRKHLGKEKTPQEQLKQPPEESPEDNPQEEPQDSGDMQWKCLTCSETEVATSYGYMLLLKHKCTGDKKIKLLVVETGEEVASNLNDALSKGLIGKAKDERTPGEKRGSSAGGPQLTPDMNIRITIVVPPVDILRFKLAKVERPGGLPPLLPPEIKTFDDFVSYCINATFEKVWNMIFVVAPVKAIKEEEDKGKGKEKGNAKGS
jgi:hypothetical protein